jgi:tRNA(Ile)-lysidine synthetase-like protein
VSADRPASAAVRAAVRTCLADLDPGERVLVALSGGPDSLALLAATVRVAEEQGLVCSTLVVDHGLQEGSVAVAARAAGQARTLGCARVAVRAVQVDRSPGSGGLEAAARDARYSALLAAAAEDPPAAAVLLGHTADDQAETVLLGLARGSGTRSLAGMAAVAGLLRRPLLDLPRALVARAAAEEAGDDPRLEPWTDPHNADRAHARVRVRTEALPVLEACLGPGVVEALVRTARLARADADALDAWADRVWVGGVLPALGGAAVEGHGVPMVVGGAGAGERVAVPVAVLAADGAGELPPAVVSRLVRRLLLAAGCPPGALTADHVWRVAGLLDAVPDRAEIALPGNLRARRVRGTLVVRA